MAPTTLINVETTVASAPADSAHGSIEDSNFVDPGVSEREWYVSENANFLAAGEGNANASEGRSNEEDTAIHIRIYELLAMNEAARARALTSGVENDEETSVNTPTTGLDQAADLIASGLVFGPFSTTNDGASLAAELGMLWNDPPTPAEELEWIRAA